MEHLPYKRPLRTIKYQSSYEDQFFDLAPVEKVKLFDEAFWEKEVILAQTPEAFPLKEGIIDTSIVKTTSTDALPSFIIEFTLDDKYVYLQNICVSNKKEE